jgi:hypothetical protein
MCDIEPPMFGIEALVVEANRRSRHRNIGDLFENPACRELVPFRRRMASD